jgi:hypothetical protein
VETLNPRKKTAAARVITNTCRFIWSNPSTHFAAGKNFRKGHSSHRICDYCEASMVDSRNSLAGKPAFEETHGLITNLFGSDTPNSTLAYTRSNTITLTAGVFYALVLEWAHATGSPELQLLWTPPNESVQLVSMMNASDRASGIVATPTEHINSTWWNGTSSLWYPPKW